MTEEHFVPHPAVDAIRHAIFLIAEAHLHPDLTEREERELALLANQLMEIRDAASTRLEPRSERTPARLD